MSARATDRKGGLSHRVVGLGFAASLALGLLLAAFVYFEYVRYDRVAALHLPPDTTLAVRVEVEKVVFFEPLRAHLLPLLDRASLGPKPMERSRLDRLGDATDIELGVDLRELLFARGPTEQDWVVVVAGKFPTQGVIDGLHRLLTEEGLKAELDADRNQIALSSGLYVGQAEDGAVVISRKRERLELALPAQPTYARLGLSRDAPASFALKAVLFEHAAGLPSGKAEPRQLELSEVEQLWGTLNLKDPADLMLSFRLKEGVEPRTIEAVGPRLLEGLRRLVPILPEAEARPGTLGMRSGTRLGVEPPRTVTMHMPVRRGEIDAAVGRLARLLAAALPPAGPGL